MEKKNIRLNRLLQLLYRQDSIVVKDTAQALGVSVMTLRRDLDTLGKSRAVERSYGRARLAARDGDEACPRAESADSSYLLSGESFKMHEEKDRIGRFAAGLPEPGDVLILDNGSTLGYFADHIAPDINLTVVCYNFNLLSKLQDNRNIDLIFVGGQYHRNDQMFESAEGLNMLRGIRANKAFISAWGIHEKLGLTCAHNYEVMVKQVVMQSALQKILVADSSKFGVIKPAFFSQIDGVDMIITDAGISGSWAQAIRCRGIELHIV